ncbi:MAG: VCBS repeat-containing protein [Pseudomonadota bacterium]
MARLFALFACFTILAAHSALAEKIIGARYGAPTERYAHGVLGDAIEWGELILTTVSPSSGLVKDAVQRRHERRLVLPLDHVFEDVEPRLFDVDQDGDLEVIVVETDVARGAALAVYGVFGKLAETPHIGTRNRWLAPLGAADLDGDGFVELAFIDRPHLAKTLRIWRFRAGQLEPVADLPGYTNHRIGEADIAGGIRACGGMVPEMIVATANWTRVIGIRFDGAGFSTRDIGPHQGRASFAKAMAC